MKIICENCQAKYSISDDKIRGKVFKIRCKRCSEPIIVRGDKLGVDPSEYKNEPIPSLADDEDDAQETALFDYGKESPASKPAASAASSPAVWFVLLDGEQKGPYSAAQLHEHISGGTMNTTTYVWKEGLTDWLPFKDVSELQDFKAEGETSATAPGGKGKGLFDSPGDSPDSGDPGLFDSGSTASTGSPFKSGGGLFDKGSEEKPNGLFSSAPAPAAASGGLFSESNEPPAKLQTGGLFSAIDDGVGPAAQQHEAQMPGGQTALTGQRNESSVLFSLSNLQQLAANPAPQQQAQPGPDAPTPGSEASGLIDIRSLASALKDEGESGVDDLLSLSPGGFSPAMNAPVLAASSSGLSKPLLYGLIGGGVLVLALLVVSAVALLSEDESDVAELKAKLEELERRQGGGSEMSAKAQEKLDKEKKELIARIEKRKAEKEKEDEKEKAVASRSPSKDRDKAEKDDDHSKRSRRSARSRTSRSSRPSSSPSKASASPKASRSPKKPSRKSASSELDDLLGGSSKKKARSRKSGSSGGVKKSLSRSDVKEGMARVARRVKRCGQGQKGTVTLKVVISPTGRVISAAPSGNFSGTPVGSCAARAVRSARFPRFSGSNLTVRYPFRL